MSAHRQRGTERGPSRSGAATRGARNDSRLKKYIIGFEVRRQSVDRKAGLYVIVAIAAAAVVALAVSVV